MGRVCDRVARLTLTQGLKLLVALISLFNFEIFVRIYKFRIYFQKLLAGVIVKNNFLANVIGILKLGMT